MLEALVCAPLSSKVTLLLGAFTTRIRGTLADEVALIHEATPKLK